MEHAYRMAEELFRTVPSPAATPNPERLDRFNKALQLLCTGQRDRIRIFRTLRYTRIRLHALQKSVQGTTSIPEQTSQLHFLEIAIGYIDTELEILNRYPEQAGNAVPQGVLPWTGTLIELVELIYGLQEMGCINDGETAINELTDYFGKLFGMEIKDILCYNTYTNIKHRKSESRTYFLDKMRERLNRRMLRDEEKDRNRR